MSDGATAIVTCKQSRVGGNDDAMQQVMKMRGKAHSWIIHIHELSLNCSH